VSDDNAPGGRDRLKTVAVMAAWQQLPSADQIAIRKAFAPVIAKMSKGRFAKVGTVSTIELAGKLSMLLVNAGALEEEV